MTPDNKPFMPIAMPTDEQKKQIAEMLKAHHERQQPTPTMTPETREELARAMAKADGREIVAAIDPNRPDDDFQPPQITDAGALSMYAGLADAIAPLIERLVAERVAAETERCAGIAEAADPEYPSTYLHRRENIAAAIRSATR